MQIRLVVDRSKPVEDACYKLSDKVAQKLSVLTKASEHELSYVINEVVENLYRYHLLDHIKPRVVLSCDGVNLKIVALSITSKEHVDRLKKVLTGSMCPDRSVPCLGIRQLVNYYLSVIEYKVRKFRTKNLQLLRMSITIPLDRLKGYGLNGTPRAFDKLPKV